MEKNKIQIKTEFPSEVVSIYSPDNELLVTSDNPLVIESTRYKILKENLSGYYAVDADGKKHEINREASFPVQNLYPEIIGRIMMLQIEGKLPDNIKPIDC